MPTWRTAYQGFDFCDFVSLAITAMGCVAMLEALVTA